MELADRFAVELADRLPSVSAEDVIVEFVEELCLRFGLFDDNTQVRLHGGNLPTIKLMISLNMGTLLDWMMPRARCPFRIYTWTNSRGVRVTCCRFGTR